MNSEPVPLPLGFSLCTKEKNDFKRLTCEIDTLKEAGEIIISYPPRMYNPYKAHHWTILKLIFLKMYARDVYTPIIGRRYPFMAFIDPFAGTGLNTYEEAKFYIPGSTLIAWFFATFPFDKVYAVGYGDMNYRLLKMRLEKFIPPSRLWVAKGDANILIDSIVKDLKKTKEAFGGVHFLAFIDPDCFEAQWRMLEKLVELESHGISGDFIILLQSRLIARTIGRIRMGKRINTEIIDQFFGTNEWTYLIDLPSGELEKGIMDFYLKRLKEIKSKALIEVINIELFRSVHYYLIYLTRETKGKSPYLATVRWLKNFVENADKRDVDRAIRIALGIERTIDYFLEEG